VDGVQQRISDNKCIQFVLLVKNKREQKMNNMHIQESVCDIYRRYIDRMHQSRNHCAPLHYICQFFKRPKGTPHGTEEKRNNREREIQESGVREQGVKGEEIQSAHNKKSSGVFL
jgi:hypothetical protein